MSTSFRVLQELPTTRPAQASKCRVFSDVYRASLDSAYFRGIPAHNLVANMHEKPVSTRGSSELPASCSQLHIYCRAIRLTHCDHVQPDDATPLNLQNILLRYYSGAHPRATSSRTVLLPYGKIHRFRMQRVLMEYKRMCGETATREE